MKGLLSSVKRRMSGKDLETMSNTAEANGDADCAMAISPTEHIKDDENTDKNLSTTSADDKAATPVADTNSGRSRSKSEPRNSAGEKEKPEKSKGSLNLPFHRREKSPAAEPRPMTALRLRKKKEAEALNDVAPTLPQPKGDRNIRPGLLPVSTQNADISAFRTRQHIRDAVPSQRLEQFKKLLVACSSVVFDFVYYPDAYLKEKEEKRQTLLELVDYVNNNRSCITDYTMAAITQMVSSNLFRPLCPRPLNPLSAYTEEEEPRIDPAWPHLQAVYEFFLRCVVSSDFDARVGRRHIDHNFILCLLDLFRSDDPRERDYLKTLLHRIYGKVMALRAFIRRAIQNVFYRFTYENESPNGVSELLEILGSIINGFALPLKAEHKVFLERSLLPLHSSPTLSSYQTQLTYCMTQYVEKDSRLTETILLGMLKYWPATNTPKEVMFINELEEILDLTQMTEFQAVMKPLFTQLAQCIKSSHFQVAERVLFLWNNEYVIKLLNQNRHVLFPIVLDALLVNSKEHWNSTVHGLTFNVSKLLAEADPDLFDQLSDQNFQRQTEQAAMEQRRMTKWQELEESFANSIAAQS